MTGNVNISLNEAAIPVHATYYLKDELIVIYNPREFLLKFHILNSLNLSKIHQDNIIPILSKLMIKEENILAIGFACTTQIDELEKRPDDMLKNALNEKYLDVIQKEFNYDDMTIMSLRLANKISPSSIEDLTLRIEPLAISPESSLFVRLSYLTDNMTNFHNLIGKIDQEYLLSLIKQLSIGGK